MQRLIKFVRQTNALSSKTRSIFGPIWHISGYGKYKVWDNSSLIDKPWSATRELEGVQILRQQALVLREMSEYNEKKVNDLTVICQEIKLELNKSLKATNEEIMSLKKTIKELKEQPKNS